MNPDKIKEIRVRLKLTQEQFAHTVGVSFPTVNKWENGKSRPSQLALRRLQELALTSASNDAIKNQFSYGGKHEA